jgi:hypothetical protein
MQTLIRGGITNDLLKPTWAEVRVGIWEVMVQSWRKESSSICKGQHIYLCVYVCVEHMCRLTLVHLNTYCPSHTQSKSLCNHEDVTTLSYIYSPASTTEKHLGLGKQNLGPLTRFETRRIIVVHICAAKSGRVSWG